MIKAPLSEFFDKNAIATPDTIFCLAANEHMSLDDYSTSKHVKAGQPVDSDRSICQMLRNVNGMTQYSSHEEITLLINFANNAVIHLGTYSKNPGNRWGGRKTRSDFTEDKRNMGLYYLENPHHSSFEMLKSLYDCHGDTNNPKVLDYIAEISYYMERVNYKIREYEQARTT